MTEVINGFKLTFLGSELVNQALERVKYHEAQEKHFVGVRVKLITEQAREAGVQITEDEIRSDDPDATDTSGGQSGSSSAKVRNFQTYMVSNNMRGANEVATAVHSISFHRGRRGFFNIVAKHIEQASSYRLSPEELEAYEFQS